MSSWLKCHGALIVAQFIFAANMIYARAAFKESPNASPLIFALFRGVFALIVFSTVHLVQAQQRRKATSASHGQAPPSRSVVPTTPKPIMLAGSAPTTMSSSFPKTLNGLDLPPPEEVVGTPSSPPSSTARRMDPFQLLTAYEQRKVYVLGICGVTLNLIGVAYGIKLTDAVTAGAFQCAIPPVSYLISYLVGYDAMTPAKLASLGCAVVGNMLMGHVWDVANGSHASTYAWGLLLLVINVTAYSSFLVLQKPFVSLLPKMAFLFRANLSGVAGMGLIGLVQASFVYEQLTDGSITTFSWSAILFAGCVNSVVPYYLTAMGLQNGSPATAALYFALQPIFVASMSFFLLDEGLSAIRAVGGVLVLTGIFVGALELYVKSKSARAAAVAPPPPVVVVVLPEPLPQCSPRLTDSAAAQESPRHEETLVDIPLADETEMLQLWTQPAQGGVGPHLSSLQS